MRLRLVLCALVALAASAPAAADVTLRYAPDVEGSRGLVIEADDTGRIRAETGPGQLLIMRDGEVYVVTPGEERPRVVRIDDFSAVAEEAARAFRQSGVVPPIPSDTGYRLADRGPQTVGTWPGTLFAIEQIAPHDPELDAQWGMSSDPALATLGRIAADPVPASRFELPGPVLSREQLRERLTR